MSNQESKSAKITKPRDDRSGTSAAKTTLKTKAPQPLQAPEFINEQWMVDRTDLELSEIMVLASKELVRRRSTPTERISLAEVPISFGEASEIPLSEYRLVPAGKVVDDIAKAKTWYVVFVSSDPSHQPMPLKIVGDAVLGRKLSESGPEIDLNPFNAGSQGVSRTHALLRPKAEQLLLSDLGSTNGTQLNGEQLALGRAGNVVDQSVISLGQLHLKILIVKRPGEEI